MLDFRAKNGVEIVVPKRRLSKSGGRKGIATSLDCHHPCSAADTLRRSPTEKLDARFRHKTANEQASAVKDLRGGFIFIFIFLPKEEAVPLRSSLISADPEPLASPMKFH